MATRSHKDGRLWVQFRKFQPYELLLCYGMTDVTDPRGAMAPVREPDPGHRRETVVADILRGDPDLPGFTVETRLHKRNNYLLGLTCDLVGAQGHVGECSRADNYNASDAAFAWEQVKRGDLAVDRLALIEGDDAPVAISVPFNARGGPFFVDFEVYLTSAETILEAGAALDITFLSEECFETCQTQEDNCENGYLVSEAEATSPTDTASVWATDDAGETWRRTSTQPFLAGEDISSVVAMGTKLDHRVIVSRGTTDGANFAEIAYADVTTWTLGVPQTTWILVDVGAVLGEFINHLLWIDWRHLYAVTSGGNVYRSDDGGASWSLVHDGALSLNEATGLLDGTIWAGGNTNTIIRSEDFGDTWTTIAGPAAWAAVNVVSVHVTPDGTLFAGASNGGISGTYDGGDEWHTLSLQGITPTNVPRIRGSDNSFIWVIADIAGPVGRVLRSTDGGATFRLWALNIPTNAGLNALYVCNPNYIFVAGEPQGGWAFVSKTSTSFIGL
jgi:photosystem II stability/assembly factor-like uncharacterized protein